MLDFDTRCVRQQLLWGLAILDCLEANQRMSTTIEQDGSGEEGSKQWNALREQCSRLQAELQSLQAEIAKKRRELLVIEEDLLLETFALYRPTSTLTSSAEFKERLEKIRDHQKKLCKADEAVRAHEHSEIQLSAAQTRALVRGTATMLLRAFNNECDYCVDHVRFDNIEAYERRIQRAFETANKLGKPLNVEIAARYKELKLDELRLAYEFQHRREQERNERRARLEQEREHAKAERELREARAMMEKERGHILAATEQYRVKLETASEAEVRADIQHKLESAAARLAELEAESKRIDLWEREPRAGYVYVVSNIGSFGPDVYKIGVTRRQNPKERVDELGDASVPFKFDLHTMVFSLDAYDLEAKLHSHFERCRVNKVNDWKEFFRADIQEIEAVIRGGIDKSVEFTREPVAEEYRESIRM